MAQCKFTKRMEVKVRGGLVKRPVPVCGLAAEEGSEYCPRHAFLLRVGAAEQKHKEDQRLAAKRAGVGGGGLPRNRREMLTRGYVFTGTGQCNKCQKPIEWWKTPAGKSAPYDPMPIEDSFSRSHFASCEFAAQFRRAS